MECHPLQELIEGIGFETRSYSGRGMYGKQCLGVEISRDQSIGDLFAMILEEVDGQDDLREIADGFHGMCWDSMGLDMIYYFPNVPYFNEEDHEDEEEDDEEEAKTA